MIPTKAEAMMLWDKYNLPDNKRTHVIWVAKTALFLANHLSKQINISINLDLLEASALLHDIDKAIPRIDGESHPDTAVRVLIKEGMMEVAAVVKTHPLHAILDPCIEPKTWEEILLYLADKMVKYDVITVDKRFDLWRAEDLPIKGREELEAAYPKVKILEKQIFDRIGCRPQDVGNLMKKDILD